MNDVISILNSVYAFETIIYGLAHEFSSDKAIQVIIMLLINAFFITVYTVSKQINKKQ